MLIFGVAPAIDPSFKRQDKSCRKTQIVGQIESKQNQDFPISQDCCEIFKNLPSRSIFCKFKLGLYSFKHQSIFLYLKK